MVTKNETLQDLISFCVQVRRWKVQPHMLVINHIGLENAQKELIRVYVFSAIVLKWLKTVAPFI